MFAARAIQKGETVLIAEPYAWVVYEEKKEVTCRHCMRELDGEVLPLHCLRCKQVWYCRRGCQKADRVRIDMQHILLLTYLQRVHRADECALLRNWELDPDHYSVSTIAEMKLMARVLSRKAHEASESEEQRNAAPQSNNPDVPPLPRLRCALNSGRGLAC